MFGNKSLYSLLTLFWGDPPGEMDQMDGRQDFVTAMAEQRSEDTSKEDAAATEAEAATASGDEMCVEEKAVSPVAPAKAPPPHVVLPRDSH